MNFGLVPSLKRAKTGYQILQAFVTLISLKLKFKVHSDLLSYFIVTYDTQRYWVHFFVQKTKVFILKKIKSLKSELSSRCFSGQGLFLNLNLFQRISRIFE